MNFDTQIASGAMQFFKVGEACLKEIETNLSSKNVLLISPTIVNLSFSVELFLKAMLDKPPKEHYLDSLLKDVPDQEQKTIIEIAMKKYEAMTKEKLSVNEFWERLASVRNAFADWRYFYEKDRNISPIFLYSLASTLHFLSSNIITLNLRNKGGNDTEPQNGV